MNTPLTHLLCIVALAFGLPSAFSQEPDDAVIKTRWGQHIVKQKPEWYGSAEAKAIAENVLRYQSDVGAWPKNTDLTVRPTPEIFEHLVNAGYANTIDNDATTLPMRFLAFMHQATGDARSRTAFTRGIDYLLAAQLANGGWPQFYPLRDWGYFSHITYNDDAMINVLNLLRDIAEARPPGDLADAEHREKASAAVNRGVGCILRTQIKHDGKLTGWCAQHDGKTFEPAWARKFEPPSVAGAETASIVKFLMGVDEPSPEIVAAVEGAARWLQSVAIHGRKVEVFKNADGRPDKRLVNDATAPPLWARFYELGTDKPVFTTQDSVIHYDFSALTSERRAGYDFFGTWADKLLSRDYPRWRKAHKMP